MKYCRSAFITSICITLSSCATMVSNEDYYTPISTNPDGAKFTVWDEKGKFVTEGVTPTKVYLSAKDGYFDAASYTVKFEKEGCTPTSATIKADLDEWYWNNWIFGVLSPIGYLIWDPATGNMWEINDTVYTTLYCQIPKVEPASTKPHNEEVKSDSLEEFEDVAIKLKTLKQLRDDGILSKEEYDSQRRSLVKELEFFLNNSQDKK